jgi:Tol biopolymer transport system component
MRSSLLALLLAAACGCAIPAVGRTPTPHLQAAGSPEVFAPGVVSTGAEEYRISFSPDGRTAYFARSEAFFPASRKATIMVTTLRDGRWSAPEVAPFSGRYSDLDPCVSPDGSRVYFSSIRPVAGAERADIDLWAVDRAGDGWGEPRNLAEVNSAGDELYPSVAGDGTLYFASDRPGGAGGWDIYSAKVAAGGRYAGPTPLGEAINTTAWEFNPCLAPDGRTLVFTSLNRPGGFGLGDLYVSRFGPGGWDRAVSLGTPVNTADDEYHPSFSHDGRSLFFVRRRGAGGDLYRVTWPPPR